jgi:hypothetical protein
MNYLNPDLRPSGLVPINGMSRSFVSERLLPMKKPSQHLIAEVPGRPARVEITLGIDLGDVWSHYCTLNEKGEVADRGRFRTSPKGVEKWFAHRPPSRVHPFSVPPAANANPEPQHSPERKDRALAWP